MGFTLGDDDKPEYDDESDPRADLQGAVDYAALFAHLRVGTNADRTDLLPGQLHNGLHFYETDTDSLFVYNSGWRRVNKGRTTFTPTWTNLTPGSSSVSAWYQVQGGICEGFISVTLASGWSIGGDISFALPVTPLSPLDALPIGEVGFLDFGTGYFKGRLLMTSGGVARVLYEPGGAAFLSAANATNPFTFANSDRIAIHFKYGV